MKDIKVSEVIKEYKSLDAQKKLIDIEMRGLRETMKGYMEDLGKEHLEIKEGKVSYTKSVRVSYDKKVLEKTFTTAQLEPAKKKTESVTVRITPAKEEDAS